ncbi:Radial spoke head 14 [Trebouxia sp. C0010 RCD-2024]
MVAMREANDILIARHSEQIYNLGIKPFPLSQPAVAVTRAFGAHAPFKLVGQLKSADLLIRQKALRAAQELLSSKFTYEQCVACGITSVLATLLQDPDTIVRKHSASCLTVIARKATGVRKILSSGALITLLDMLQDEEVTVRNEAYKCMAECCHHSAMQTAMVDTISALGRLLANVKTEEAGRAEQGLAILLACALGEWLVACLKVSFSLVSPVLVAS